LAVISRLLDRKGFDLISAGHGKAAGAGPEDGLHGHGEDKYHVFLTDVAGNHPDQVAVRIAYDQKLAHRISPGPTSFDAFPYEPAGSNSFTA
jgi:starch synthase